MVVMTKIKVSDLKEGNRFSKSVFMDEELQSMVVSANLNLKVKELDRLVKWDIEEVFTKGTLILDSNFALLEDVTDSKFFNSYVSMIEQFSDIVRGLKKGKKPEIQQITDLTNEIIKMVSDAEDIKDIHILIGYISKSDKLGEKYAVSGINCAMLSTLVGLEMKLSLIKLKHLVIAALLHDFGMLKVPEWIIEKNSALTPEEIKIVRMHTMVSYQIVINNFRFPESIANIALQHHERWDGKGYPAGIAGEQINLLSRIIAVTDSFEAMNRTKAYRSSIIGYTAIKQILNESAKRYDPSIVKFLIKVLGIYPPGSFVALSDSCIGKVVKVKKVTPLRPLIKLFISADGKKCEADNVEIDLAENSKLFIVKVIDMAELEEKITK